MLSYANLQTQQHAFLKQFIVKRLFKKLTPFSTGKPFFKVSILLLLIQLIIAGQLKAQCAPNATLSPAAAVNAGTGALVTISTTSREGQYSQITGIVSGASYRFGISRGTDAITVRIGSAAGAVLGSGFGAVTLTATSSADLFVHWNTAACGGGGTTNRTTTVQGVPAVTSLGSASGCVGSPVTINGTNLSSPTAVTIGGTAVAAITSNTSTQIVATIGTGTTGNVVVTNAAGTGNSGSSFTVNQLPLNRTVTAAGTSICYNTGTDIVITNPQSGVNYQLRNNAGNVLIGTAASGTGASLNLPTGNLTSTTTFNVLATTGAGCSAQMATLATVSMETTNPVITCPATQTLNLDASCLATLPDYRSLAGVSDNCTATGSIVITQVPSPGTAISGFGNQTITLTATDLSGNSSNCTFNVIKADVTAPVISCPSNITTNVGGTCNAVVNYTITATDNCSGTSCAPASIPGYTLIGTYNGHTYFRSTTAALWPTAKANSIAVGAHLATISSAGENTFLGGLGMHWGGMTDEVTEGTWVWVNGEPVVYTSWNPGEPNNGGNQDYQVLNWSGTNWDDQGTTTGTTLPYIIEFDCLTLNLTSGFTSGSTFPLGVTTVSYDASDASGNSSNCSFTVTVLDPTPPVITCPAAQTLSLGAGCSAALPNYTTLATKSDNCTATGSIVVTQSPAAGTVVSGSGAMLVTLTATDASGNSSNCNFTVNKVDATAPVITCPAAQTLNLNAACDAALPNYITMATITDNCTAYGSLVITQSPAAGTTVTGIGTIVVTITATDAAGNSSNCNFNVTKMDITPPVMSCPSNITVTATPGLCGAIVNYTINATDNCSGSACAPATIPGYTLIGTLNGHTYFRSAASTTWAIANSDASALGAHLVTITSAAENSFLSSLGAHWTGFTDQAVEGTWAWITGEPVTYTNWNAGEPNNSGGTEDYLHINYSIAGGWNDINGANSYPAIIEFDCITTNLVIGYNSGSLFPVGTTTVSYNATDASGNTSASCSFTVTVTDITPPTIVCPANISVNAAPGTCDAIVTYSPPVANDNCGTCSSAPPITGYTSLGVYNGNAFYISNATATGPQAFTNAAALGAQLASIHSTAENTFIRNAANAAGFTGNYYIGLNDIATEGTFLWPSGAAVSYTNWNSGEPNNSGNEDYTQVYPAGTWNDIGATSLSNYVIEVSCITPVQISGLVSGSTFPLGISTISYSATDPSGNTANCSFTVTVSVNPLSISRAVTAAASPLCANGSTNIQVALSDVGVNYQLRNNATNSNIGSPVAGNGGTISLPTGTLTTTTTFNVYATNIADGCSWQLSNTVTVTINPIGTVTAGSALSVCQSAAPAAITLSGASVGGGASTGAWSITSGGGTLSSTAQTATPGTVTYTPAANYSGSVVLTLTTDNPPGPCGVLSASRTITVNALPAVTAGVSVCVGGNITLSPAAGGTWVSNNIARATVTNAGVVTGVGAGAVTFTYTQTSTGCSNTTTSVTVNALPVVSAASQVCVGNTITVTPTTAGTWSSSNPTAASVTNAGLVTGLAAGTASFTYVVTATGCSNTTSPVTVNALPVVTAPAAICILSPASLSPATGGTWTSSNILRATVTNAGIATGLTTGAVTFTYTETATGCTKTTPSVAVSIPPVNKIISVSLPLLCAGSSTTVSVAASQTGVTYQLRNNATGTLVGSPVTGTGGMISLSTTPVLATTIYNVLATDATTGCTTQMSTLITVTVNLSGQWIGGSTGDWNNAANWCGGIPLASTSVNIPAGTTVNIQSANASAASVTIAATASLVMTGNYNLSIASGGSFANNGTFNASASTGTVAFLGNGTISGTTTFQNVDAFGAIDFGVASTVSGTFTIQTGGSVTGHSPYYTCPSSTLLYKPGSVFTRGLEWTSNSAGAGYPANVIVQNNTTINFPASGDGFVCYDVQIDAGSGLRQNYGGGSASLSVGRNITINGTLELGGTTGGDLSLGGNWTRNAGAVFNANDRKVTFDGPANFSGNGTVMSTISAPASSLKNNEGGFGGENFAHLWINKTNATDSVVLLSNITVNREIGFTKGTFSLRNNEVTIVSNSTRTADIAPVAAPADVSIRYAGTGRFVIQRFIQNPTATRSWRLLTAPLQASSAPSINQAWMEGVVNPDRLNPNGSGGIYNPWPGYGVHITGPGGVYSAANGFDQGTSSSSILYAPTGVSTWLTPLSTISTKITDQQGWMLFVRGDRGFAIGNQYSPSENTTLEPKGKINIGDVAVPVVAGKQVIGNPYPAAISLMNINIAGTAGKNSSYYMWDPKMFTSYTQPGKWVTFTGVGTGFVQTTSESPYLGDGTVESGQAFVIDAPVAGTLTFHESDKKALTSSLVGIANATGSRPAYQPIPIFRSDIYADNGGEYKLTDGVLNIFAEDYSNNANEEDAKKIITFNTKESLSILRDSVKLAIEKRKNIEAGDTIFFSMSKFNELPYQFRFEASNFIPGSEAFLEDAYTGTRMPVSTNGATAINFNINADPLSKAENRFRVVFSNLVSTTLPVTFSNLRAWQQNKNIMVEWKVENQINMAGYDVEKSTDGVHFEKIGNRPATANSRHLYNFVDQDVAAGVNYYRIQSIENSGTKKYSQVVKVIVHKKGSVKVYPNPVTNGIIRLHFSGMNNGIYNTKLISDNGQLVHTGLLTCAGGDSIKEIKPGIKLAKGTYHLEITNKENETVILKVLIQ